MIKYPFCKEKTIHFDDHEFYLSFEEDQHAMHFQWWVEENWDKFVTYYGERQEND